MMDPYGHPQQMHLRPHLSGKQRGMATHAHNLVVEGDESRAELLEAHAWLHPIPEVSVAELVVAEAVGAVAAELEPLGAPESSRYGYGSEAAG